MNKEYMQAFSEVYEILKLMPIELKNKIPDKFQKMIEKERDQEYVANICEPIENQELKEETVVILGLIYRDYICDESEREELRKKDAMELYETQKEIEKMKEQYKVEDLFKKKEKNNIEIKSQESKVLIIKKETWVNKILKVIKRIFY